MAAASSTSAPRPIRWQARSSWESAWGSSKRPIYDPRNGHPINDNFADYIVPTIADTPQIDVHFLDIPDPLLNEYGARGIGEIGLAGIAPAITAAVYHATGVRVRELPVRIEDLLGAHVGLRYRRHAPNSLFHCGGTKYAYRPEDHCASADRVSERLHQRRRRSA